MSPYISKDNEEHLFIHPGLGKLGIKKQIYKPNVFEQSVTLTASIWDENDPPQENMDNRNFLNWKYYAEYSPLVVGLVYGFGIVLLIMSTVVLWRCCLLSATKKVFCKGSQGEMNTRIEKICKNVSPLRNRMEKCNQNGFERLGQRTDIIFNERHREIQRSATISSMPWHNQKLESGKKLCGNEFCRHRIDSNTHLDMAYFEPAMTEDKLYLSHLCLNKLDKYSSGTSRHLSRSTPALEELYAKVNFSKKRKNRMRKDDAAIIALSKSHSGQNNILSIPGSAIVVYNERTAL